MGESRTTLTAVFGGLYSCIDGYVERNKVQFCLRASILISHCLPIKLYMKLYCEKAEASFNFCMQDRSDESLGYHARNQCTEFYQFQRLPYLAVLGS
jgi:hypothetical protein